MINLLSLLTLGRPQAPSVKRFHARQHSAAVNYTPAQRNSRFLTFQEHRELLGSGQECWQHACESLRQWKFFPTSHFLLYPLQPKLAPESTVAVCMKIAGGDRVGLWICCGCRILNVIDEDSENSKRFGFTYQTLHDHVASGEETFLVEYVPSTDEVFYHIFSDSLPRYVLLYPLRPIIHALQYSVKKLSGRAIREAVAGDLYQIEEHEYAA